MTQHNELLKSSQKFEELFFGTLGNWKTNLVDLEFKKYSNPICSRPYPVPNVHKENFKKEVER